MYLYIKHLFRCALAIWFTLDPDYVEATREVAEKVVDKMKNNAFGPKPLLYEKMEL